MIIIKNIQRNVSVWVFFFYIRIVVFIDDWIDENQMDCLNMVGKKKQEISAKNLKSLKYAIYYTSILI